MVRLHMIILTMAHWQPGLGLCYYVTLYCYLFSDTALMIENTDNFDANMWLWLILCFLFFIYFFLSLTTR